MLLMLWYRLLCWDVSLLLYNSCCTVLVCELGYCFWLLPESNQLFSFLIRSIWVVVDWSMYALKMLIIALVDA
ncbi:hypothetical protein C2G38_2126976 [Gigaspora rosea]|uniref:Uncharacterized protein n=1 Tax=Gigaspora rosea TaxID=44941 RepID=A0A397TUJ9_9GLOM|nr:hypothetical protein C2G38_2126976 [Gigaspora rosea]